MQDKKTFILEKDAVQEISFVEGNIAYKSGARLAAGKTFTRFSWNGMPFSVDDSHPFVKAFNDNDLKKVTLIEDSYNRKNADGTETPTATVRYGSHICRSVSRRIEKEDALHEAQMKAIVAATNAELTPAMMEALLNADI